MKQVHSILLFNPNHEIVTLVTGFFSKEDAIAYAKNWQLNNHDCPCWQYLNHANVALVSA